MSRKILKLKRDVDFERVDKIEKEISEMKNMLTSLINILNIDIKK